MIVSFEIQNYQERVPSGILGRIVRCLWSLSGVSASAPQHIVPDGNPEIILHLG